MLADIQIEGLAIIEKLAISFTKGFNVLTGETGAGKSILIKALQFLMGGKVSIDFIRKNSPQANVTGLFLVEGTHPVIRKLEDLGIPLETDTPEVPVLIRRLYTQKGRSQIWINDTAVTLSSLKDIEPLLVDVFSQHENQKLLEPSLHTFFLDRFLKDPLLTEEVKERYLEIKEKLDALEKQIFQIEETRKNLDYWQYRLEELEIFRPQAADFETIATTLQQGKQLIEQKKALEDVLLYFDLESDANAVNLLREITKKLQKTEPEIASRLKPLSLELESIHFDLTQRLKRLAIDETEVERLKERHFGYKELFRKHNTQDPAELEKEHLRIKGILDSVEKATQLFAKDLTSIKEICTHLEKKASQLTFERRQIAKKISQAIENELEHLSMKGSVFEVIFDSVTHPWKTDTFGKLDKPTEAIWQSIKKIMETTSPQGKERAHFYLSANPGEPCLPLEKIASGGEVSRIMLALKKILSTQADTCVLVFDEIDTGISGKVADQVGKKIQELSKNFQVLCISHLPQVAVYADKHFLVKKKEKAERTETSIQLLNPEESTSEIARLLSGEKISESSLANARTLLAKAKQTSKNSNNYVH